MKHKCIVAISILFFSFSLINQTLQAGQPISITILYDNYIFTEGTQADWGFSCLIQGTEKTILFDTGTDYNTLEKNINQLGVDIETVEMIVLSHNHNDHTGGLNNILTDNSGLPVYLGLSFPQSFSENVRSLGSEPIVVEDPIMLCEHVYSTGEISGSVNEQTLIIDTDKGLVVIVGCSHPGIVNILHKAQEVLNKNIYLVLGGFHLYRDSENTVKDIIEEFRTLGVEKCGATHCTGDRQIAFFQEAFGDDYVPMGVGQVIQLSANTTRIRQDDFGATASNRGTFIGQNYPNPVHDATSIPFKLAEPTTVTLKVFDLNGREITTLMHNYQPAGFHQYKWNAISLPSGVYFYGMETGDGLFTKKFTVVH